MQLRSPSEDDDNLTVETVQAVTRIQHRSNAVVQSSPDTDDKFSPATVFEDKHYKHIFRVTMQMTKNILDICAITDLLFTLQQDHSGRNNIDPFSCEGSNGT